MNRLRFLSICFLGVLLFSIFSGCAGCGRKKNMEEVLSADPAFKETLTLKEDLDAQIGALEDKLAKEKSDMEKTIRKLKKDYVKDQKEVRTRIKELKANFAPVITAVEVEEKEIEGQIKSRSEKVRNLRSMLKELKSLSEKAVDGASDYSKRIVDIEEQIKFIEQEISSLRYDLRIVNLKKSFLK